MAALPTLPAPLLSLSAALALPGLGALQLPSPCAGGCCWRGSSISIALPRTMTFDFDQLIDRSDSDSWRWNRYRGRDVLPLWVADMDFAAAPPVRAALQQRVEHGIFGYANAAPALRERIVRYVAERYGWAIEPDWLVFLPGVVPGLHAAVRHLTTPEQHVLLPRPVYHHFREAAQKAPRAFSEVAMRLELGRWVLPVDGLDQACNPRSRLLLLSNPHNPGGTVFDRAELEAVADFCLRHDLLLCSDEIHAELILTRSVTICRWPA